jgi:hemoglobin
VSGRELVGHHPTHDRALVAFLLSACTAEAVDRLYREHAPDRLGCCVACSMAQSGPTVWPCSIRRAAEEAQRRTTLSPPAVAHLAPGAGRAEGGPVSGGRDLFGWAVVAVAMIVWVVVLAALLHRRRRPRPRRAAQIESPARPAHRVEAAEHDLRPLRPPAADVDSGAAGTTTTLVSVPELFPGIADTHLLTECPMVNAPGKPMPLRDWLRHFAGVDAWSVVLTRFYHRAAADPKIAGYFTGVNMEQLQRHFLAALMIVTGQGVTVGVVRRMREVHAGVRSPPGEPIDAATWDRVIGVLAGVLGEIGTPPATLVALATTTAPIRAAIITTPEAPARR